MAARWGGYRKAVVALLAGLHGALAVAATVLVVAEALRLACRRPRPHQAHFQRSLYLPIMDWIPASITMGGACARPTAPETAWSRFG